MYVIRGYQALSDIPFISAMPCISNTLYDIATDKVYLIGWDANADPVVSCLSPLIPGLYSALLYALTPNHSTAQIGW